MAPTSDSPLPSTIPGALRRAADLYGEIEAVVGDGIRMTWRQLDRDVDELAAALLASGVAAGDRVAIWTPNRAAFVAVSFAIYRAGATLVPISSRYRGNEAHDILSRSRAVLLFTMTDFLEPDPLTMLTGAGPLPSLRERIVLSGPVPPGAVSIGELRARADEVSLADVVAREGAISGDDICDIIFTSGTTGRPKGAMLRHGASITTYDAWSDRVGLRTGDRFCVVFPFFHTSGLKSGILASAIRGATICPLAVFEVGEMLKLVATERITLLPGPPTVFQSILADPRRAEFDLSSLRTSITGSAVVPEEIIRRMRDELHIPDVVTGYGLTETTGTISMCRYDDPPELIARTCGMPIAGVEARVVDDDGAELPRGTEGEIWSRGPNTMAGYLDDPESTAETITPDGWLKTGDIGTMDENGRLRITDRKKEMFIVGGFNAYPAEIEARLLEHPDIVQAAVIGVPDERMGEVGLAALVLRPGGSLIGLSRPALDEVLTPWCRERMANFKVPRTFVSLEVLPLNATGKVAKAELKLLLARKGER